jgi:signal peptidase I
MEEKLFWIGILVGIYLFLSHHLKEKGKFKSEKFLKVWHSIFTAIIGFIVLLLLTVSLDNRKGEVVTAVLFSKKQIMYGIIGAIFGGIYGYWRITRKKVEIKNGVSPFLKEDMEWSETIFSAVILASVVMYLFIQAFKIPSGSMRMTFLEGDHLFVNKFIYGIKIPFIKKKILKLGKIDRSDIVVFQFPSKDPNEFQCGGKQYGKDFIKRVIGLPGDEVEIKQGIVFINGKQLENENYVQPLTTPRIPAAYRKIATEDYQKFWEQRMLGKLYSDNIRDNFGPVKVPPGSYIVMGDNRDHSCDSRYWGPVPDHLIKGRAWFIYWPISRISSPE